MDVSPSDLLARVRRSSGSAVVRLLLAAVGAVLESTEDDERCASVLGIEPREVKAWRAAAGKGDEQLEQLARADAIREDTEAFALVFNGKSVVRVRRENKPEPEIKRGGV